MDIEVTQMQMREIVVHAPADVLDKMAGQIESEVLYGREGLQEEFETLVAALRGND